MSDLSREIFKTAKKVCGISAKGAERGYGVAPRAAGQNCENRHPARSPARVNPGVEPRVLRQALASVACQWLSYLGGRHDSAWKPVWKKEEASYELKALEQER